MTDHSVEAAVEASFAEPDRDVWEQLDSVERRYLVAEQGDEIVGSLMVTTEWSDWRNGFFWWVQSVYVRPEFRRQGVYRALYTEVRIHAKAQPDVCGIRLYVENENEGAQKTYEALGMKKTGYRLYEEEI